MLVDFELLVLALEQAVTEEPLERLDAPAECGCGERQLLRRGLDGAGARNLHKRFKRG